jgi:hypothetical protein
MSNVLKYQPHLVRTDDHGPTIKTLVRQPLEAACGFELKSLVPNRLLWSKYSFRKESWWISSCNQSLVCFRLRANLFSKAQRQEVLLYFETLCCQHFFVEKWESFFPMQLLLVNAKCLFINKTVGKKPLLEKKEATDLHYNREKIRNYNSLSIHFDKAGTCVFLILCMNKVMSWMDVPLRALKEGMLFRNIVHYSISIYANMQESLSQKRPLKLFSGRAYHHL